MIVCRPLKAPFLLDNSVVPAIDWEDLYRQRKTYGEAIDEITDSRASKNNGGMLWNAAGNPLEPNIDHYKQYWKFSNINHLIEQYNFVGYHDVCNFQHQKAVHVWINPTTRKKGFEYLYPGYNDRNSSGLNHIFKINK